VKKENRANSLPMNTEAGRIPMRPPKAVAGNAMARTSRVNLRVVFIVVLSLTDGYNARPMPRSLEFLK
jgi:hypothetical protein